MFLEKLHKEERFLARELGHNSKPEVPWLINALLNLVNFMKNHPCQSLIKFEDWIFTGNDTSKVLFLLLFQNVLKKTLHASAAFTFNLRYYQRLFPVSQEFVCITFTAGLHWITFPIFVQTTLMIPSSPLSSLLSSFDTSSASICASIFGNKEPSWYGFLIEWTKTTFDIKNKAFFQITQCISGSFERFLTKVSKKRQVRNSFLVN